MNKYYLYRPLRHCVFGDTLHATLVDSALLSAIGFSPDDGQNWNAHTRNLHYDESHTGRAYVWAHERKTSNALAYAAAVVYRSTED